MGWEWRGELERDEGAGLMGMEGWVEWKWRGGLERDGEGCVGMEGVGWGFRRARGFW